LSSLVRSQTMMPAGMRNGRRRLSSLTNIFVRITLPSDG
jgi:hypothetical protein